MTPLKRLQAWIEYEKTGDDRMRQYDPRPEIEHLIAVALAVEHVIDNSPGTPAAVKSFLKRKIAPLLESEAPDA